MNQMTTTDDTARQISKPRLTAGSAIQALIPTDIESTFRLAQAIAASNMTPKAYGNDVNKVFVGILAGLEIGLAPFQALQSIAVIGNNPSVWGDGALALVQASGLLVDIEETFDEATNTATCRLVRSDRSTPIIRTFSYDDAKKAGLLNKQGPWSQYPKRMCQMRARAFALRDGFADVLKGMRIAEEVNDYQDALPAPQSTPRLTSKMLEQQAQSPAIEHQPAAELEPEAEVSFSEILDDRIPALKDDQGQDAIEPPHDEDGVIDDAPEPEPSGPPAWIAKHDEIVAGVNAAATVIDLNAWDAEYKKHCVAMPVTEVNALGQMIADKRAALTGKK
jgi:hypothetical protein